MAASDNFPVSLSSLHFPSAEQSISQTLSSLRRSALSVANRLHSIETDACFVSEVADHYDLPLVANERCGSWYIPPETKSGSAYFKSTDGHTGQWDFSFRRLNLQILPVAREHGGCIIVDSTRRGKHDLRKQLGKPIRVAWANRTYFHPTDLHKGDGYHLFVLCSASKRVHGAEMSEGGYIQGAGDDSEGWAHGLTPPVFWANKSTLFQTTEEDLPGVIQGLVEDYRKKDTSQQATLITPTQNLYISQTDSRLNDAGIYDLVIDCNGNPAAAEGNPKRLNLGCGPGKLGSRDLRKHLDSVQAFVSSQLASDPSRSLLVTCESGKDLSAGALLAVLCLFYNDNGKFTSNQTQVIGKQFIRQRLAWITSAKHDVNPSRSTLQSINAFLM
ncbi:hypothetical protein MW887_011741 [Aspergillus wentii]|nr:hypothetical protein MW887_011741 [Aspergillus wentii]